MLSLESIEFYSNVVRNCKMDNKFANSTFYFWHWGCIKRRKKKQHLEHFMSLSLTRFQSLIIAQTVAAAAPWRHPTSCTTPWRMEPTGATCPWSQTFPALPLPPTSWKALQRERDTWGFSTSLPPPALTRPWKTKWADTSRRAARRPPPPVTRQAPPLPVGLHLQNPIYWPAAHSMTTRSICGDGTGFRVTLGMNHGKHNRWEERVAHRWTLGWIILKREVQLKHCVGVLYPFQVFAITEYTVDVYAVRKREGHDTPLVFQAKLYYM